MDVMLYQPDQPPADRYQRVDFAELIAGDDGLAADAGVILADLAAGRRHRGGGGAAPEFEIRPLPGSTMYAAAALSEALDAIELAEGLAVAAEACHAPPVSLRALRANLADKIHFAVKHRILGGGCE